MWPTFYPVQVNFNREGVKVINFIPHTLPSDLYVQVWQHATYDPNACDLLVDTWEFWSMHLNNKNIFLKVILNIEISSVVHL